MTNLSEMPVLLGFQMPSLWEWLVIGAIGLLFFGKRLPEVGRSLGLGIVEFKKGLKGVSEDVEAASNAPAGGGAQGRSLPADQPAPALPGQAGSQGVGGAKFDPYTGKPLQPAFDPYTGKPLNQNV